MYHGYQLEESKDWLICENKDRLPNECVGSNKLRQWKVHISRDGK